jgi:hypothetical protein
MEETETNHCTKKIFFLFVHLHSFFFFPFPLNH